MSHRRHARLHRPTSRAGWLRSLAVLAVAAVLAAVVVPAVAGHSRLGGALGLGTAEASDPASTFVAMINSARTSRGLAPLQVSSELASVAAERASIMARDQTLSHTPDLGARLCCDVWVAENSGYGSTPSQINQMFLGSAPHLANILYANADDVGVGTASAGGWLWVAEVFRDTGGSGGGTSASSANAGSTATSSVSSRAAAAVTASRSSVRSAPVQLSPQQLLTQRLATLRTHLIAQRRHRAVAADPLTLALRYTGTLNAVTG